MTDFCRCDNPIVTDGKCDICQFPVREVPTELLHKPPPPFSREPRAAIPPDPPSWRVCPDCGAENTEHKPDCPKANWNVRKDTPRRPNP